MLSFYLVDVSPCPTGNLLALANIPTTHRYAHSVEIRLRDAPAAPALAHYFCLRSVLLYLQFVFSTPRRSELRSTLFGLRHRKLLAGGSLRAYRARPIEARAFSLGTRPARIFYLSFSGAGLRCKGRLSLGNRGERHPLQPLLA